MSRTYVLPEEGAESATVPQSLNFNVYLRTGDGGFSPHEARGGLAVPTQSWNSEGGIP